MYGRETESGEYMNTKFETNDDVRKFYHECVELIFNFEAETHLTENHTMAECTTKCVKTILDHYNKFSRERESIRIDIIRATINQQILLTVQMIIETGMAIEWYNKSKRSVMDEVMKRIER